MQAWIDRTNDGLSGMPADGISLPLKKAGTSARPAGATRRLGYINTGRNASCPHMALLDRSRHRSITATIGLDRTSQTLWFDAIDCRPTTRPVGFSPLLACPAAPHN